MGKAYKCDGCNSYFSGVPPNRLNIENTKNGIPVSTDEYLPEKTVELCPECSDGFSEWLHG